jgi:hypothetical protein
MRPADTIPVEHHTPPLTARPPPYHPQLIKATEENEKLKAEAEKLKAALAGMKQLEAKMEGMKAGPVPVVERKGWLDGWTSKPAAATSPPSPVEAPPPAVKSPPASPQACAFHPGKPRVSFQVGASAWPSCCEGLGSCALS